MISSVNGIDDEQALLRAPQVFELARPLDVVSRREMDALGDARRGGPDVAVDVGGR